MATAQPFGISCKGGLNTNLNQLEMLASPGLATKLTNFEVDPDGEVVSDDDPLLEINKEDQNVIADDEIDMDEDISFIDDNEITEDDNGINVEINEDDKN